MRSGFALLALAAAAWSAAPTGALAQARADLEEVVVTGSRLPPDRAATSSPVTATPIEALKDAAPRNLADALVQLPAFAGNFRSENPVTAAAFGGTRRQGGGGGNVVHAIFHSSLRRRACPVRAGAASICARSGQPADRRHLRTP